MEYLILGPLEVADESAAVALGTVKERLVLAVLLLHANEVVSRDRLIDELWGESPPPTAKKAVNVYVSKLRKTLGRDGADPIETAAGGYRLSVAAGLLDVTRMQQLLVSARESASAGELDTAAELFRQALALWRGRTLAGLEPESVGRHEIEQLEELRLTALMDRIDCDLALGRHEQLIGELNRLVGEYPLLERLRAQQMLAFYRSDRQAEALDAYQHARQTLVDDLGIEPSEGLQRLQRGILAHDPALEIPTGTGVRTRAPATDRVRPRGRRWLPVAALAIAGATAVGIVLGLRDGTSQAGVTVKPNTVVRIDPGSNRIVDSIPVGRDPASVVATDRAVWVTSNYDPTLARVDLGSQSAKTVAGIAKPGALARDSSGDIYVLDVNGPMTVWRLDPRTAKVVQHYNLTGPGNGIAISGGSLWATDSATNTLDRFDLDGGHRSGGVKTGTDPLLVTSGYGALWVANTFDGTVSVIRPGVPGVQTLDGLRDVKGMAAGEGGVWIGSGATSAVTRIDPDTRRKVAEIPVARNPLVSSGLSDVTVGAGSVWAVNSADRTVVRIDPHTNKITTRIQLPGDTAPRSIDIAGNDVWVTVGTPTATS